jgi:ribonuclease HI
LFSAASFMDDLVVVARTRGELQRQVDVVDQWNAATFTRSNAGKGAVLHGAALRIADDAERGALIRASPQLTSRGAEIPWVSDEGTGMRYLGAFLDSRGDAHATVAWCNGFIVRCVKALARRRRPLKLLVYIANAAIWPSVLYRFHYHVPPLAALERWQGVLERCILYAAGLPPDFPRCELRSPFAVALGHLPTLAAAQTYTWLTAGLADDGELGAATRVELTLQQAAGCGVAPQVMAGSQASALLPVDSPARDRAAVVRYGHHLPRAWFDGVTPLLNALGFGFSDTLGDFNVAGPGTRAFYPTGSPNNGWLWAKGRRVARDDLGWLAAVARRMPAAVTDMCGADGDPLGAAFRESDPSAVGTKRVMDAECEAQRAAWQADLRPALAQDIDGDAVGDPLTCGLTVRGDVAMLPPLRPNFEGLPGEGDDTVAHCWTDGSMSWTDDVSRSPATLRLGAGVYFPASGRRFTARVPPGLASSTRPELFALLLAAAVAPPAARRLVVHSDSTAAISAAMLATAQNSTPLRLIRAPNHDLLCLLRMMTRARRLDLATRWTKGHAGDVFNNEADALARAGAAMATVCRLSPAATAAARITTAPNHAGATVTCDPRLAVLLAHRFALCYESAARGLTAGAAADEVDWAVTARALNGGSPLSRAWDRAAERALITRLRQRCGRGFNRTRVAVHDAEGDSAGSSTCPCGAPDDDYHFLVCSDNEENVEAARTDAVAACAEVVRKLVGLSTRSAVAAASEVVLDALATRERAVRATCAVVTRRDVAALGATLSRYGRGASAPQGASLARVAPAIYNAMATALELRALTPHRNRLADARDAAGKLARIVPRPRAYDKPPDDGSTHCRECGYAWKTHRRAVCVTARLARGALARVLGGGSSLLSGASV